MKKLTAVVLALILALALVPAMGEEDYSGFWYLNTAGLTAGSVQLNADGTMVYTIVDESMEGTWAVTEAGVDLTVQDATLSLTKNETGLINEEQGIYITREPEKMTLEQVAAYLQAVLIGETPELPEGVTEEEMMNALTILMGEMEQTAEAAEAKAFMTHEEFVAAEIDDEVTISTYVQATQSWWDNKITVYAQSPDGAYFIYELACSEEDAAKLVAGTPIIVKGYKGEWGGEVEIMNATFEFAEGEPFIAEAEDVTAKIGTDDLINCMNEKVVFKGLTVDGPVSYKDDKVGADDIYFTASKDGLSVSFCVEYYLTGADTDVYKAVAELQPGDVVDIEAYLYWYEGANPHVIGVTKAE